MGLYDSFLKDNGNDIQVKCFSSMGGFMDVFHKGDCVPTDISDSDFNILKEYGQNFNIYCYMTSDDIIFVRDGKYVGHAYYLNLTDADVTDIACIDKHGNELLLNCPSDYIKIRKDFLSAIKI